MDRRNVIFMALGLLIVLAVIGVIGECTAPAAGKPYTSGYSGGGPAYAPGQPGLPPEPPPRRVYVRSRSANFPNQGGLAGIQYSDSSRYTYDNKGDDGSTVRWQVVSRDAAQTVYAPSTSRTNPTSHAGESNEYNHTRDADHDFVFVWVSANGLEPGMLVENAWLGINIWVNYMSAGALANLKFTCRLDTISADYAILNTQATSLEGYVGSTDAGRMAASWDYVDAADYAATRPDGDETYWDPPLNQRDDFCDFGPRSATTLSPDDMGSPGRGYHLNFDVTDAVQQVLKNAEDQNDPSLVTRGFLFVFTGYNSTTGFELAAGDNALSMPAPNAGGNPVFHCEASDAPAPGPWLDVAYVPITLEFHDSWPEHASYIPVMTGAGLKFTASTAITSMDTTAGLAKVAVQAYCRELHNIEFAQQGYTGTALGEFTPAELDDELARKGYWHPATNDNVPCYIDTSRINVGTYPSGSGHVYGKDVLARLVAYGYDSFTGQYKSPGRSPTGNTSIGSGAVRPLLWSRVANPYAIMQYTMNLYLAAGTKAQAYEATKETVDKVYYWGIEETGEIAHGSINGITHGEVTVQELSDFIAVVRDSFQCLEFISRREQATLRRLGTSFVDPADITAAPYMAEEIAAAASADSFRAANPGALGDRMLQVFITAK